MNIKNTWEAWRKAPNRSKVSFKNIKAFIQGTLIDSVIDLNQEELTPFQKLLAPIYLREQVYMRAYLSMACLKNITCVDCGCCQKKKIWSNVPCNKYYHDRVSACYSNFMSKDEWHNFKLSSGHVLEIIKEGKKILINSKNC